MIKKTKNYDMFTFRSDNREEIKENHIKFIMKSIQSQNLLEYKPILVNGKMEVIDGQTRLKAAERLGVDIYYQVKEDVNPYDVILMNIQKAWTIGDYLNFYCENKYEEYLKLKEFMNRHQLTIRTALILLWGSTNKETEEFKTGKYVFKDEHSVEEHLHVCWFTINYIRKMNGASSYAESGKFWKALVKLVNHENFELKRWTINLQRMVDRIGPRANTKDYYKSFIDIYNWNSIKKIREGDELFV